MSVLFVLITLLIPPLGLPLGVIGLIKNKGHWKMFALCIALAFASWGYSYIALTSSDIVRYYQFVEETGALSFFGAVFHGHYSNEGLWLFDLLCWIIARLGDPRILPAISIFIIYFITIYICCKIGMDSGASNSSIILYVVFALLSLNFYSLVNNVRNVLAYVIIGYAAFRESYERKRDFWTYMLYVLPVFLHTSAVILIVLRISQAIWGRHKYLCAIIAVLVTSLLELLHPFAESLVNGPLSILGSSLLKAYSYFTDTSSPWGLTVQDSGSEKVFKLLYIMITVAFCITILLVLRHKHLSQSECSEDDYSPQEKEEKGMLCAIPMDGDAALSVQLKKYLNLLFGIGLMAIACIPMLRPEYWRFSATIISLGSAVYWAAMQPIQRKGLFPLIVICMLGSGCCCCVLWVRNLMLYSDFKGMVINAHLASPIYIIIKGIVNWFL